MYATYNCAQPDKDTNDHALPAQEMIETWRAAFNRIDVHHTQMFSLIA